MNTNPFEQGTCRNAAKAKLFLSIFNLNLKSLSRIQELTTTRHPQDSNLANLLQFLCAYIRCRVKSHAGLKGVEKTTPFRYTKHATEEEGEGRKEKKKKATQQCSQITESFKIKKSVTSMDRKKTILTFVPTAISWTTL